MNLCLSVCLSVLSYALISGSCKGSGMEWNGMAGAWESNVAANQVGSAFSFFVFVFSLLISIVGGISNKTSQTERNSIRMEGESRQTGD